MFKKMFTVSMVGLAVAGLTACSGVDINSQHKTDKVEAQFTVDPITSPMDVNFDNQQVRVTGKNTVEVYLGGSGSCPPVIDRVDIVGNSVQLRLKDYGAKACTMDYRPYSQVITDGSGSVDLNKFDFKLCNIQDECTLLPKNVKNVATKA